jgi:tRNA pseudouridine32 synthase/23S rRNA pseudouridine746 synthase/23S rRNA pseudouridine1911/1915/1917 synthase
LDGELCRRANTPVTRSQKVEFGAKRRLVAKRIPVLFEDKDLVVLSKPAGLLSVDLDQGGEESLHSLLKEHYAPHRIYVVHRLDRDTSGLIVFARSQRALDGLKKQLQGHRISRQYVALVEGKVISQRGRWDSFLQDGKDRVVRTTGGERRGKRAVTHYRVLGRNAKYSCLSVRLETGRKNQIRVHCQAAGHSIVGDMKYGASSDPIKRLGLHAESLTFTHPVNGRAMSFESPAPDAFQRLVQAEH